MKTEIPVSRQLPKQGRKASLLATQLAKRTRLQDTNNSGFKQKVHWTSSEKQDKSATSNADQLMHTTKYGTQKAKTSTDSNNELNDHQQPHQHSENRENAGQEKSGNRLSSKQTMKWIVDIHNPNNITGQNSKTRNARYQRQTTKRTGNLVAKKQENKLQKTRNRNKQLLQPETNRADNTPAGAASARRCSFISMAMLSVLPVPGPCACVSVCIVVLMID